MIEKNKKLSDDMVEEIFNVDMMNKECIEMIRSIFPNYIETYGDWVRFEFVCIPKTMLSFDWKHKIKDVGIDAIKQEFIRRGYDLKRRVQTLDYDMNGVKKKIKIIMWETNKKLY